MCRRETNKLLHFPVPVADQRALSLLSTRSLPLAPIGGRKLTSHSEPAAFNLVEDIRPASPVCSFNSLEEDEAGGGIGGRGEDYLLDDNASVSLPPTPSPLPIPQNMNDMGELRRGLYNAYQEEKGY